MRQVEPPIVSELRQVNAELQEKVAAKERQIVRRRAELRGPRSGEHGLDRHLQQGCRPKHAAPVCRQGERQ